MSSSKSPLPDFSALQAAIAPADAEVEQTSSPAEEASEGSTPAADVFPNFSLNTKPAKKPAAKPEPKAAEPAVKSAPKAAKTESIAIPDFGIKTTEASKPAEVKPAQPVVVVKAADAAPKASPAPAAVVAPAAAKPAAKKQTGIAAEVAGLQDFAAAITGEAKVAGPAAGVSIEATSVSPVAKETKVANPASVAAAPATKATAPKSKSAAIRGQDLAPIVTEIAAGVAFAGAAAALYQGFSSGAILESVSSVAMLIVAGAGMLSLSLIARLLVKLNDHGHS